MARVLIFGASGFMGPKLVSHLRAGGHDVITPSRVTAPVTDAALTRRAVADAAPEIVINLAAISRVGHDDERAFYDVNAFGHLNVLQAVEAAAPQARVYLASTGNIYGTSPQQGSRESDLPTPQNHYAVSKLMAEQFNALYADRLTVCAVRPFNCIGHGQNPVFVVAKIVDAFRRRLTRLELGALTITRDYIDLRDICAMWDAVIAAPAPPPIVNFGAGETATLTEVITLLEQITGHRLEASSVPGLLRARDILYQRADTTVLSSLGFKRHYKLAETLTWMLEGDVG